MGSGQLQQFGNSLVQLDIGVPALYKRPVQFGKGGVPAPHCASLLVGQLVVKVAVGMAVGVGVLVEVGGVGLHSGSAAPTIQACPAGQLEKVITPFVQLVILSCLLQKVPSG